MIQYWYILNTIPNWHFRYTHHKDEEKFTLVGIEYSIGPELGTDIKLIGAVENILSEE